MIRAALLLSASVAAAGLLAPLSAQRGDVRFGLWASVGGSPGLARIECSRCPIDRKSGIGGYAQLGGTPAEHVSVAVEFSGWRAAGADTTREFVMVNAVANLYPWAHRGLFVKVGAGAGRYAEESTAQTLSSNGFALQAGAGYEIPLTRHVWVVPWASYLWSPSQGAKHNRIALGERVDFAMVQGGIGVTWRKK